MLDRLPDSLVQVVSLSQEECTSTYGPLVIRPTQFDFGWGTARFQSVRRQGRSYLIRSRLTAEGQPDGPVDQEYVLTPLSGGDVSLQVGGETRRYRPCAGRTSGISVETPPPGPLPEPPALPITPGVYVIRGTPCAQPPNAAFRIYDGVGLSGSATRACRTTVRNRTGRTYQLDNSCEETYSGRRTTARQTFVVDGADGFRLQEAGEGEVAYELCPIDKVPGELRRIAEGRS